jgi:hypothetical protein
VSDASSVIGWAASCGVTSDGQRRRRRALGEKSVAEWWGSGAAAMGRGESMRARSGRMVSHSGCMARKRPRAPSDMGGSAEAKGPARKPQAARFRGRSLCDLRCFLRMWFEQPPRGLWAPARHSPWGVSPLRQHCYRGRKAPHHFSRPKLHKARAKRNGATRNGLNKAWRGGGDARRAPTGGLTRASHASSGRRRAEGGACRRAGWGPGPSQLATLG